MAGSFSSGAGSSELTPTRSMELDSLASDRGSGSDPKADGSTQARRQRISSPQDETVLIASQGTLGENEVLVARYS